MQQRYVAFLEETLAGLAAAANDRVQPARIGAGTGSALLGINRRERVADGRVVIGENPSGAVDREVSVLRGDDLAGKPIATVMSAGCHTVVLGAKSAALSPDFVGPAREIVESVTLRRCFSRQSIARDLARLYHRRGRRRTAAVSKWA